jgi:hypothetical protein
LPDLSAEDHVTQNAADIPIHNTQRKAAIAHGGVRDHAGAVTVTPIPGFDLNQTIFNTLEGKLPRFVIQTRIAKESHWAETRSASVEAAYDVARATRALPEVAPDLLAFLVDECDFDVEHADGSFLDHLYFCFEYTHLHLPEHSPLVMLLHSILGTGTNTFAMTADKIPALKALMDDVEWTHVEAFPSVLRLLYDRPLRAELWSNTHRLDALESIRLHRVIDNEAITMTAADFWTQLNYQMIHLIDFLPVSNWVAHANDTAFIIFRDLFAFLNTTGKLAATLDYTPASGPSRVEGEPQSLGAKLVDLLPVKVSEKMAAKSVRRFSTTIGHSMDYELTWRS